MNALRSLVNDYEEYLTRSFNELWSKVSIDPTMLEAYSVVGALLSRQVTLSIQLARSPAAWNGHSAPLFLRAQVDLHITISWILCDLSERSKKYVLHGLGEEKLLIEQFKNELEENPAETNREMMEEMINIKSAWVNSQRHEWMVEVNLGHWAQLNTHSMSKEADCEKLYKFAYKPFSHATHSMWPHVSVYNSKHCENPLHRYHLIPELFEAPMDVDFLYRSCKYVHRTYESFVDKFALDLEEPMPLDWWNSYFTDDVESRNNPTA
jgi:ribosomal protein S17E